MSSVLKLEKDYNVTVGLDCENIRFSLLFAAGDVSRRSSSRTVLSGEERGETDVFAGYSWVNLSQFANH